MGDNERVANLGDFRKESAKLLSDLIADLNAHNQSHGAGARMGRAVGRFLVASMDDGKADLDQSQADVMLESAQTARTSLAELHTKYDKVLTRFGLSIGHETSEGLRMGLPAGLLTVRVSDVHAFLRYAQSIQPVLKTEEGATNPFQTLLWNIQGQIAGTDFEHPSPSDEALVENLAQVLDTFKRIGPDLDLDTLEKYARFAKEGKLGQYLVVEREYLWPEPGEGFGPADWVRDTSPEGLESRWSKAIDALRAQEKVQNGSVAPELREHLLRCVISASEKLEKLTWPEKTKERMRDVLDKYEKLLNL